MERVDYERKKGRLPGEKYGAFLARLRKMKNVFVAYGPVTDQVEYDLRLRLDPTNKKHKPLFDALEHLLSSLSKEQASRPKNMTVLVPKDWLLTCLSQDVEAVECSSKEKSSFDLNSLEEKVSSKEFFKQISGAFFLKALLEGHPKRRKLSSRALTLAKEVVRHGQRAILVSKMGIDSSLHYLRQELRKNRVYGKLVFSQTLPTATSLTLRLPGPFPTLSLNALPNRAQDLPFFASQSLVEKEVDPSFFQYAKLFYCDNNALITTPHSVLSKMMAQAKRVGAKVAISLDHPSLSLFLEIYREEGNKHLLQLLNTQVDYLFVTQRALTDIQEIMVASLEGGSLEKKPTQEQFLQALVTSFSALIIHEQDGVGLLTPHRSYYFPFNEVCKVEGESHSQDLINAVIAQALMAGDSIVDLKKALSKALST